MVHQQPLLNQGTRKKRFVVDWTLRIKKGQRSLQTLEICWSVHFEGHRILRLTMDRNEEIRIELHREHIANEEDIRGTLKLKFRS
jgi:hypothetical protein